jgi:hypothetical protein
MKHAGPLKKSLQVVTNDAGSSENGLIFVTALEVEQAEPAQTSAGVLLGICRGSVGGAQFAG